MGSGSKRKSNDVVRINRPKKTTGLGGGGAGSSNNKSDVNRVCPPGFDIGITSLRILSDGTPVSVRGDRLFVFSEHVGELSVKHRMIVAKCGEMGIRYMGHVVNKAEKVYARFEQAT